MKEKRTTLGELSYNGTQVVRQGESTIPAFEKTCFKCGTKFFYISEAIKHDRDGDYVVCPSCGAFIAHQERPKTADFILPKCTSDVKCEDRSPKHSDSFTSLEEAAMRYAIPAYMKDVDENYLYEYPRDPIKEEAFIAGAQWQKEQDQPITGNSLEQEWLRFVDKKKKENRGELPALGDYGWLMIARHFANWQKEQMLEDAVDADVNTYEDLAGGKSWAEFVVKVPTNNIGDKVKIIIVNEEEEK